MKTKNMIIKGIYKNKILELVCWINYKVMQNALQLLRLENFKVKNSLQNIMR